MSKAELRTDSPPHSVMKEARGVYQRQLALPKDKQQKDIWWAINKFWDINIYLDENDNLQASLYFVKDGNTETDKSWEVIL